MTMPILGMRCSASVTARSATRRLKVAIVDADPAWCRGRSTRGELGFVMDFREHIHAEMGSGGELAAISSSTAAMMTRIIGAPRPAPAW